jgi:hypothetical protein
MRLRLTLVVLALLVAGGASQERTLRELVPEPPPGYVPEPLPEPTPDEQDAAPDDLDDVRGDDVGFDPDRPRPETRSAVTPAPYFDPDCPEATEDNALACRDFAGND